MAKMSYAEMKDGKKPKGERQDARERKDWRGTGGTADWANADPTLVLGCIGRVASVGGALRFGYTSDGGAYAIGIYGSGDPYTEYVRPGEDINAFLSWLYQEYEA